MTFSLGKYSYGKLTIRSWSKKDDVVKIGKFCSIADNVTIYIDGNHNLKTFSSFPFLENFNWSECPQNNWGKATPNIGNDVWIGHGVTIYSGVVIGDGAAIAGNSVVTKSVPPYAIVAGNPAKIIKYRFLENQIEKLLYLRWWDLSLQQIREKLIPNIEDIDKIIEILTEIDKKRSKKRIVYGARGSYEDVTEICFEKCRCEDKIVIPEIDLKRAAMFGDPKLHVVKHIIFVDLKNSQSQVYAANEPVVINIAEFEDK